MAAAKPVVATQCGGPQEIVVDGETGFLVAVDNPEEMAMRILALLNNEQLMQKMGKRGRENVEREFSAERYAAKFCQLYDNLAGQQKRAVNPWYEAMLNLVASMGSLGCRTLQLEHEVRDLRAFESMIKGNALYRGLKSLIGSIKR